MSATLSSSFASSKEEFWSAQSTDISQFDWLFHPLNSSRFESPNLIAKILNRISYYSSNGAGWTYFFQRTLADWLGISERWLREILRRLKLIGWIEDRQVRKNRQYRIAPLGPAAANYSGETSGETEKNSAVKDAAAMDCEAPPPSYMQHHTNLSTTSGTIINGDDGINSVLNAMELAEIKVNPVQDQPLIKTLCNDFGITAVIIGIILSKVRLAQSRGYNNSRINSLRYCVPAIREVAGVESGAIRHSDGVARPFHSMEYMRYAISYLNRLKQRLTDRPHCQRP